VVGIELRVRAESGSQATFVLEKLEIRDQPPGYLYPNPTPLPPVNMGFNLDVTNVANWQAKPDWDNDQIFTEVYKALKYFINRWQ